MLQVSVRQRRCVGNGCCAEIAPEIFVLGENDVAFVCQGGQVLPGETTAIVPEHLEAAVLEAADECPAECILVELAR